MKGEPQMTERRSDVCRASLPRPLVAVAPRPQTVAPFLGSIEPTSRGPGRTCSSERTGPKGSARTPLVPNPSATVTWCPHSHRSGKDEFSVSAMLMVPQALLGRSDDVGTLDVVHTPPTQGDEALPPPRILHLRGFPWWCYESQCPHPAQCVLEGCPHA